MTSPECALVDYGAGNLASVRHALRAAGARVRIATRPDEVGRAMLVVVPGVGHFAATGALDGAWRRAVRAAVAADAVLLGICLGLQWLFDGSEEAPDVPGLGLLTGTCRRLPAGDGRKVPHVGWNTLDPAPAASRLLAGIPAGTHAYFTHAYAAPVTTEAVATSTHGVTFAAAVERGRVFGTQFHPEKSGAAGLRMLTNVVRAAGAR